MAPGLVQRWVMVVATLYRIRRCVCAECGRQREEAAEAGACR